MKMAADGTAPIKLLVYLKDMDEVRKVFNRFDANGDDTISSDELAGILRTLGLGKEPSHDLYMPPEAMESSNNSYMDNSLISGRVMIVFDATKDRTNHEFRHTISNIRKRGGILRPGDTIVVFGVLHRVLHPMGYKMGVAPENFLGATHTRAMEEEVSKKVDLYVRMLQWSAEECEEDGVDIEVKVTAGTPVRKVVIQEVAAAEPTWVILDRHLRRELRYYLRNICCKVAIVSDNCMLQTQRSHNVNQEIECVEGTMYYSLSKRVPQQPVSDVENTEVSSMTVSCNAPISSLPPFSYDSKALNFPLHDGFVANPKKEESDNFTTADVQYHASGQLVPMQQRKPNRHRSLDAPFLCISCELKTDMDPKKYSYSEIQLATDDFSSDNLLGEGGYGRVYKGELKGGQLIAAKVRKEASTQGFSEFQSEIFVLSFARHKNIVMLLGYCCRENVNILVYEYICNKSLDWHLFNNTNHALDWDRRLAIAIGTAKGLRFLHEECRGSPIIHRDMRPSNILLTHDFVPMLGDFGLAKWKTSGDEIQTRILGTLGYLAPEYAENGTVSVLTDVYSFGIVLIQLISGRKAVDSSQEGQLQPSVRQWALPLIETLKWHELVDPRLGDSFNPYQMYNMARIAYLCVQANPEMRPSMAEVLRFLEGETDHFHHLTEQFIPHYSK